MLTAKDTGSPVMPMSRHRRTAYEEYRGFKFKISMI